ncbi:MAG: hypothetical protein Q8K24_08870 [Hydrogenophaga sp.]|nr:hypothetical protein [Hydrogenophaga sp.]
MSLEQALAENTAAIKHLITVMSSVQHVAPATSAKKEKQTATPAAEVAAPAAVAAPAPAPTADSLGNPVGTVYIHIPAHKTVAAVKPGDVMPSLPSQETVTAEQYTALRQQYAANLPAAVATAPAAAAPAPAAAPVATAPSVAAPAATASGFPDVVAKIKELHALVGNDGLTPFLAKHGVSRVPELAGKASNDALIAEVQALIDNAKLGL